MANWFFGSSDEPDIEIKKELSEEGVYFSLYIVTDDDSEKLTFPIVYSDYFDLENLFKKDFYLSLQVLEDLWHSGKIEMTEQDDYFISNDKMGECKDELIGFLGFVSDEEIIIEIEEVNPIGTKNFKFNYHIHHEDYGYITNFYDRIGYFYPADQEETVLLSQTTKELFELIEHPPFEQKEQFEYVAKVKKKAKEANAELSDYLKREDYYFPEDLDAEVDFKSVDEIELKPKFNDLDESLNQKAEEIIEKDNKYGAEKESFGKNRRIFFDDEIKKDYTQVKNNNKITGSDVPKFINNPGAYLPDSIDLDKFSDRVKGLKKYVYTAQPYVTNESEEMGWFDIEAGINIKSESDEKEVEETNIELTEFEELVKEAKENGEEYILYEGDWIKITEDSEEFIEASNQLEELTEGKSIDEKKIPYVFDIYENINKLEYSLDLLEKKEKLIEADALEYSPPKLFNGELRPYQKEGYVWLNRIEIASLGGLLADEMGLGKTVQVVALMSKLRAERELSPSLVVVPASLLKNWREEIKVFCPEIDKIYIHRGSNRVKKAKVIKNSEVVLTTYSTLVQDQIILGEIDWRLMVCDEVQKIKNQSTRRAHAVKAQKAEIRLALSGTPIQNSLSDLWSIMDYVQPGLLDSYKTFENEFVEKIEEVRDLEELKKHEKKLKKKIKPVYMRRTKEGKLKNSLPTKKKLLRKIEMSEMQKNIYNKTIMRERNTDKRTHLKTLQELIQICSHPRLIEGGWESKDIDQLINESPKLDLTLEILSEVKAAGEKALIFTRYKVMQYMLVRAIRQKFTLNNIPIINGDHHNRLETVNNFNERPGFSCMVLSPLAAGTGLNIVGANHVIHYTRWWNPAVEKQATDRVHRIGQDKQVYIYYPIVTAEFETVEEKLSRLLQKKKKLAENIVVPNKELQKEIRDELIEIPEEN